MICSVKPVLTEDLCIVQTEELSIIYYMCEIYICWKATHIHKRQAHLLVREDVTQGLLPQEFSWKKISGRGSQGAWRQDDLFGGKQPAIKQI
jgi:hypothetical protein